MNICIKCNYRYSNPYLFTSCFFGSKQDSHHLRGSSNSYQLTSSFFQNKHWYHNSTKTCSTGTSSHKTTLSQSSRKWLRRQQKDQYVKKARKEGSPSRAIFKLEEIIQLIYSKKWGKKQKQKQKHSLFDRGNVVIDLGASPGGWSLFTSNKLGPEGLLIAVDLLPLNSSTLTSIQAYDKASQFHFIHGDFTHDTIKSQIFHLLSSKINRNKILKDKEEKEKDAYEENLTVSSPEAAPYQNTQLVDCIVSDMAANFTGDKLTDALRTMNLCEDAMMFAAGSSCFDDNAHSYDTHLNNDDDDLGLLRKGGSILFKFFACGKEHEMDLMKAANSCFEHSSVIKPPASRKESSELYLFATGYKR